VRYGGKGIMIYWHVEKSRACIYFQLKTCSSSEVAAMMGLASAIHSSIMAWPAPLKPSGARRARFLRPMLFLAAAFLRNRKPVSKAAILRGCNG
jgi:Tn3 transposase DDE domain